MTHPLTDLHYHHFTGALDEAITLMAKAPLSKLRDLIRKYKPSVLPPDESKIGFAGDDMVWSKCPLIYC